jgi:hypothetical protein
VRESNTLATTKQAAQGAVAAMTRPEGMTRVTWASVHLVLEVIAQSYPKAFPSQVRISKRTGIPLRSVRRYIARAVAAGLLVVEADAGAQAKRSNGSKTNRYHVVLTSADEANLDPKEVTYSYGVGSSSSSRRTSSSVPRSAPAAQDPSEPQRSTVVSMREWEDDRARDVGAPAAPPLRSKQRRRPAASDIVSDIDSRRRKTKSAPKPPPDWVRLGDYFNVLWQQMQMNGHHKNTRGLENYRMVRTYIRKHFANKTELEIRKLMEEFVIAVSNGTITLKPGQSGWMCFTGAWGRARHVDTGDIYAAYKEK